MRQVVRSGKERREDREILVQQAEDNKESVWDFEEENERAEQGRSARESHINCQLLLG